MNAYLILGHGEEEPVNFEERNIIPEGYTLVTIAQCGLVTTTKEVCPSVEAFSNSAYEEIIKDPKKNKEIIKKFLKKDIHIYEKGDRYPNLTLQMFLDWKYDSHTDICKSGLYQFPISREDLTMTEGTKTCDIIFKKIGPYSGFIQSLPADFDASLIFKGSLFPTAENVEKIINEKGKYRNAFIRYVTVPLETLFEKGGPGIYYYVVCRHPKNIQTPANLADAHLSEENQAKYEPYQIRNWISKLDEIIPLLEENQKSMKPTSWSYKEFNSAIKNYKKLKKVPLIRQLSITQQQGKGKTMRKKSVKQKTRKQKK